MSTDRGNADCPYVNDDQACCGNRFSLGRLDQAFTICFGSYHGCSMYRELRDAEASRHAPHPVVLTVNGYGRRLPIYAAAP